MLSLCNTKKIVLIKVGVKFTGNEDDVDESKSMCMVIREGFRVSSERFRSSSELS